MGAQRPRKASWPMNSLRWPPWRRCASDRAVRRRAETGQGENLRRRRDVILRAGEQVERAADVAEVDALPVYHQLAVDEIVTYEEMLDDPEVEPARDGLRVLEPVLELAVPLGVRAVVDMRATGAGGPSPPRAA